MPQFVQNNTIIYYESYGCGVPLVFVQDPLYSHEFFQQQIDYFKGRFRVVVLDLRGSGESGKLGVSTTEIIYTHCKDICLLLDYLRISSATLIGIAGGGALIQQFAVMYPYKVHAIVVADCCRDDARGVGGKMLRALEVCSWISYYLPGEMFSRSLRMMYSRWLPAYKLLRKQLLHKRPTELIKQYWAISRINSKELFPKLHVPVMLIVSEGNDFLVNKAKEMIESFSYVKLVIIEDSIQPSNLCQPLQFNRALHAFLNENDEQEQASY